jgi:hypothetical protein
MILSAACLGGCVGPAAQPARPQTPAGAAATTAPPSSVTCTRDDPLFGPVRVSTEAYASRAGVMAQRFSELATTKQRPLEECGLKTVIVRLTALRCDNGSNPFGNDLNAAHMSRAGSFGPGGRCDSIIDRYDVPCPEKTYQIFADGYVCPPGLGGD